MVLEPIRSLARSLSGGAEEVVEESPFLGIEVI